MAVDEVYVVPLGDTPKRFTLVMPYYENPEFLEKQMLHLDPHFPDLDILIVDDGSPTTPAERIMRKFKRDTNRLYRIEVDVRWNWLAARNIGVFHADTEWVMLTDMDHILPIHTMDTLVIGKHDPNVIYRFSRVGAKTHPHPNSWFMTRTMFWKVGGYDEALSGYYGTDGEYRRRCAATAPVRIMSVPLELHEFEGDSSTIRYKRKQPEDATVKKLIRQRGPKWQPKTLSFPYHQIAL